ncbi:MAG TPA: alpha/beta fold hydrolase [Hyphomicrobiaceae bacterium]|jgi:pimeloyl-ACP methyl ester carboxylesterase|nr:alpha/beta fold hydrolase [Hyphomicrobiaceae bacterium]
MLKDARGAIAYDEEGSGPTILFVPGSWATGSAWRGVADALRGRFRLVTTSLLGYGGTQERRSAADCSIERQAEMLEAVVRRAGHPLHVVAHSYGGLVCLAVAMRGAVPLASLTVIEPVAFGLLEQAGEPELNQQFTTARARYFHAFESGDGQAARWIIDFFAGDGTFDGLPPRMRDHIVATTPTHYFDMRTGFDPPLSAHADLSVPMLILKGDRTHPALARSAEILSHAAPNASLVTVAGASHFMIATHPSDVAELVAGHISKSTTPA